MAGQSIYLGEMRLFGTPHCFYGDLPTCFYGALGEIPTPDLVVRSHALKSALKTIITTNIVNEGPQMNRSSQKSYCHF